MRTSLQRPTVLQPEVRSSVAHSLRVEAVVLCWCVYVLSAGLFRCSCFLLTATNFSLRFLWQV